LPPTWLGAISERLDFVGDARYVGLVSRHPSQCAAGGGGYQKAVCRWRDLNEVELHVFAIMMLKPIQIMANEHFRLCAFILGCVYRQEGSWWDQYDDR